MTVNGYFTFSFESSLSREGRRRVAEDIARLRGIRTIEIMLPDKFSYDAVSLFRTSGKKRAQTLAEKIGDVEGIEGEIHINYLGSRIIPTSYGYRNDYT